MKISREWAMPSKNTFKVKPIRQLILKHLYKVSVDPFANNNKLADITNDLNPKYGTDYNLDALDFLKGLENNSVNTVLFDPPYSPRQVAEVYDKLAKTVNMQTTQASFWTKLKKEICRITKDKGIVITCSWNSGGIGKKYGFHTKEILMVAHGGWHNDTIIVVEQKCQTLF
jgi:hypothetical protein